MLELLLHEREYEWLLDELSENQLTAEARKKSLENLLPNDALWQTRKKAILGGIDWQGNSDKYKAELRSRLNDFDCEESIAFLSAFKKTLTNDFSADDSSTGKVSQKDVERWVLRCSLARYLASTKIADVITSGEALLAKCLEGNAATRAVVQIEGSGDRDKRLLYLRHVCEFTHAKSPILYRFILKVLVLGVSLDQEVKQKLIEKTRELGHAHGLAATEWETVEKEIINPPVPLNPVETAPSKEAPLIAVVIKAKAADVVGQEDVTLPHQVQVLCYLAARGGFEPPFGDDKKYTYEVEDFCEENRVGVRQWLQGRLREALDWLCCQEKKTGRRIEDTRIDFYLPLHLLSEPVHVWPLKKIATLVDPVGKKHPVAVRLLDRYQHASLLSEMEEKQGTDFGIWWHPSDESGEDCSDWERVSAPCLAFAREIRADDVTNLAIDVVDGRFPYAVWLTSANWDSKTGDSQAQLWKDRTHLQGTSDADGLLKRVYEKRARGAEPMGTRLHLLFEPPGPALELGNGSKFDISS